MADLKFQKLTPINDVDMTGYEDAFEYIFKNEDICNVAISGPYSSGKSSVLETYKKKHAKDEPIKQFLHVYLASFSDGATNDRSDEMEEMNARDSETIASSQTKQEKDNTRLREDIHYAESTIEGKILNQLIQQIPYDDVPLTRFRIKRGVDEKKWQKITVFIVCLLILLAYVVYNSEWDAWVTSIDTIWPRSIFNISRTHGFQLCVGILIVLALSYGLYQLLLMIGKNNILKKVSIQGNEIEILSDEDDSYFDKYMNEILYLLEYAKADVIVFEDIDRFNNVIIFERLREINKLANIRRKQNGGSVLKFFYLLRDDIFTAKDRTKFFDYILPVVPVIDGSNSYNKLKIYLEDAGLFDEFDDFFLREICIYIDDLRLLKNIVNEFVLFESKLRGIKLDYNKLFSLITFKNIFPKDYADLQLRRGFVFTVFSSKEKLIQQKRDELNTEIDKLKDRIASMDSEIANSVYELNLIKEDKRKTASSNSQKTSTSEYNEWCKTEYVRRKQAVEDNKNQMKDSLYKEMQELTEKRMKLDSYTIAQIIDGDSESEVFRINSTTDLGTCNSFYEVKENENFPLLKFLLSNGYIDETYNDYITFFYDNSLTSNDKIYLRGVLDRKLTNYEDYHLDNIALILENLKPFRFRQREILNFGLVEFLLKDQKYREYLIELVVQLKETANYDFIVNYFNKDLEQTNFVKLLNELWPEFFSIICTRNHPGLKNIQRKYSLITLLKCDEKVVDLVNKDNILADYISAQSDYLNFDLTGSDDIKLLINAFQRIGIRFERFYDVAKINTDLLCGVYNFNLYKINVNNLCFFMHYDSLWEEEDEEELDRFITILFSFPESPLYQYLSQEPEISLKTILEFNYPLDDEYDEDGDPLTEEVKFYDDEKIVIFILNNDNISLNLRMRYLLRLQTRINNLMDINDKSFHKILVESNLLVLSADNILFYYLENGWTIELVNFLNKSSGLLDYKSTNFDIVKKRQYVRDAVKSDRINENRLQEIINQLGEPYATFNYSGWPVKSVEILSREKLINMTRNNLEFIRKNYQGALRAYIASDFKNYIKLLGTSYNHKEVEELLGWKEISVEDKLLLLSKKTDQFTALCPEYPQEVLVEILKNHRKDDELPQLYKQYDNYTSAVKEEIFCLAETQKDRITKFGTDISSELMNRLVS